jgi:hypothetical protein
MPCSRAKFRIAAGLSNGRLKPIDATRNVPSPSSRSACRTARSTNFVVVGQTCPQPV